MSRASLLNIALAMGACQAVLQESLGRAQGSGQRAQCGGRRTRRLGQQQLQLILRPLR